MDLKRVEIELKKRWEYPYHWGHRQQDDWDHQTNFIYQTYSFERLLERLVSLDKELINYGLNRWYNFWSAMAIEQLFATHPEVTPNKNKYDKLVDFSINGIPFDHKTSIYPKGFKHHYPYALSHKTELSKWLYANQSQQGRKHMANRLFVVLYDSQKGEHWQLKAEIASLKKAVDAYLQRFSEEQLIHTETRLSDIIFVER